MRLGSAAELGVGRDGIDKAAEAVEFYKKAFGAEAGPIATMPNGKVVNVALKLDGITFFLCDEMPEYGAPGPQTLNGSPVTLQVYVDDCDALFERAVAAGCTVKMPMQDMFWGDRYGVLEDPFGHRWSVATHVRDVPPAEMQRGALSGCMNADA